MNKLIATYIEIACVVDCQSTPLHGLIHIEGIIPECEVRALLARGQVDGSSFNCLQILEERVLYQQLFTLTIESLALDVVVCTILKSGVADSEIGHFSSDELIVPSAKVRVTYVEVD